MYSSSKDEIADDACSIKIERIDNLQKYSYIFEMV